MIITSTKHANGDLNPPTELRHLDFHSIKGDCESCEVEPDVMMKVSYVDALEPITKIHYMTFYPRQIRKLRDFLNELVLPK